MIRISLGWRIRTSTGCTADVLGYNERMIVMTTTTHRGKQVLKNCPPDRFELWHAHSHLSRRPPQQNAAPSKGQAWWLNKSACKIRPIYYTLRFDDRPVSSIDWLVDWVNFWPGWWWRIVVERFIIYQVGTWERKKWRQTEAINRISHCLVGV